VTKYRATAEVKFTHGTASDAPNSFNAREVIENLANVIEYPEE